MNASALIVLAQDGFVERQIGSLFCGKPLTRLREACLVSWRSGGRGG